MIVKSKELEKELVSLITSLYNSGQIMMVEDKVNPVDLAVAMLSASRMIMADCVGPHEANKMFEDANNYLIEHQKVSIH